MRTRRGLRLLVSAAAIVIACGKGPSGPGAFLQRLSISGPATIAPGASATFTATGYLSDGTTQDYTGKVGWQSQDVAVVSFSGNGQATGGHAGETMIAATYSASITAKQPILVLPPGTFRLTGVVTASGLAVAGASVSVTSGVGMGLSTLTGADGRYRLYGVSGNVTVSAVKLGYRSEDQVLTVTDSSAADFALTATDAPPDLSGTYSMEITASSACPDAGSRYGLPNNLRTRRYVATISQDGVHLQVALSGSEFVVKDGHGNNFSAEIGPTGITFRLGDGYYYSAYPDVLESLGSGRGLLIEGPGDLVPLGTSLVGHFFGSIDIGNLPVHGDNWWVAGCDYLQHDIVLTRQPGSPARIRR